MDRWIDGCVCLWMKNDASGPKNLARLVTRGRLAPPREATSLPIDRAAVSQPFTQSDLQRQAHSHTPAAR